LPARLAEELRASHASANLCVTIARAMIVAVQPKKASGHFLQENRPDGKVAPLIEAGQGVRARRIIFMGICTDGHWMDCTPNEETFHSIFHK
jgi:hypothetical protein